MTNIVKFPAPRSDVMIICPDCQADHWQVIVSPIKAAEDMSVMSLVCNCGFQFSGIWSEGLEEEG